MQPDSSSSGGRIEVHVRIRPRLESLGETFLPPAARKHSDNCVALDIGAQLAAQQAHEAGGGGGVSGSSTPSGAASRAATPSGGASSKRNSRNSTPVGGRTRSGSGVSQFTPIPSSQQQQQQSSSSSVNANYQQQQQGKQHIYTFDSVCDAEENQSDVFEATAMEVVDQALNDFTNGAIMCYGPTGTGKTYTLLGDPKSTAHCGLLPRTLMTLLEQREERSERLARSCPSSSSSSLSRNTNNVVLLEEISLVAAEVYLDDVRDLLGGGGSGGPVNPLKSFAGNSNSNSGGTTVVKVSDQGGLKEMLKPFKRRVISNMKDYRNCAAIVNHHRAVCSHDKNSQSSRSHAIFFVEVKLKLPAAATAVDTTTITPEVKNSRTVCIALVDLAGSERVKRSQVEGHQLQEAQAINKSLSALCTVVTALYNKQSHIPYRDSKLTRMLRPCFETGGNLCTIVHIPPSPMASDEAAITLKFAERMKQVTLADTGVKNTKQLFSKEDLELEKSVLYTQRSWAEACSEIRICNASAGYVPRRVANSSEAQKQQVFRDTFFDSELEREGIQKETRRIRDELVEKRMAPLRQRTLNMKRQLQKHVEEVEVSQTALKECDAILAGAGGGGRSPAAVTTADAAATSTDVPCQIKTLMEGLRKAKRSRQVATAVKATLQDHIRLCRSAKSELEDQRALLSEEATEMALDTAAVEQELKEESEKLDWLFNHISSSSSSISSSASSSCAPSALASLLQSIENRSLMYREYLDAVDDSRTTSSFLTSLERMIDEQQGAAAPTHLKFKEEKGGNQLEGHRSSWTLPLTFGESQQTVSPAPSLLGSYQSPETLGMLSKELLLHSSAGIPVRVRSDLTLPSSQDSRSSSSLWHFHHDKESFIQGRNNKKNTNSGGWTLRRMRLNKEGDTLLLETPPPPIESIQKKSGSLWRKRSKPLRIEDEDGDEEKRILELPLLQKSSSSTDSASTPSMVLELQLHPRAKFFEEVEEEEELFNHCLSLAFKDKLASSSVGDDFIGSGSSTTSSLTVLSFFGAEDLEAVVFGIQASLKDLKTRLEHEEVASRKIRPVEAPAGSSPLSMANKENHIATAKKEDTAMVMSTLKHSIPLRCIWGRALTASSRDFSAASTSRFFRSAGASSVALPFEVVHELALEIRHFAEVHSRECFSATNTSPLPVTPGFASLPNSRSASPFADSSSKPTIPTSLVVQEEEEEQRRKKWKEVITVDSVRSLFCTPLGIDVFRLAANWDRIILAVCQKELPDFRASPPEEEDENSDEPLDGEEQRNIISSLQPDHQLRRSPTMMVPDFHFPAVPAHLKNVRVVHS